MSGFFNRLPLHLKDLLITSQSKYTGNITDSLSQFDINSKRRRKIKNMRRRKFWQKITIIINANNWTKSIQ